MSVHLIADSASELTQREAQEINVHLLPLSVHFGEQEYQDGVTLSHDKFYTLLAQSSILPTTSQITPWQYDEVLRALPPQDEAVILTLSGKLSGTLQSARIAAEKYGNRVKVVDTLSVTLGERVLVQYAVQLRTQGLTAEQIVAKIEEKRQNICVLGVVDTLDYLKRGGRISKAAAMAGGLLNIKPVLTVQEGELTVLGKARGLRQSNNLLNETAQKRGGINFNLPFAAGYSGLDDTAVRQYLQESCELWQNETDRVPVCRIGATIGTHVGPGAVAVAFFTPQEQ